MSLTKTIALAAMALGASGGTHRIRKGSTPNKYSRVSAEQIRAVEAAAKLHNAKSDPSRQQVRARLLADARADLRFVHGAAHYQHPRRLRRAIARNDAKLAYTPR